MKRFGRSSLAVATLGTFCFVLSVTARAGIIPAGTILNVKTLGAISTKEAVGRQFTVQLAEDITVDGKVIAPAGIKFIGKIITSTKIGHSPLTLDLISANLNGRSIPVTTTGAIQPQSVERGRARQVKTRDFILPPGTRMQFHLARPVTI